MKLTLAKNVANLAVALVNAFFAALIAIPVTLAFDAPTWAGVMFTLTLATIYTETERLR